MPSVLAVVLFVVFALVATVGAFLIGAHFRSRRAGVVAALVTLAFFLALGAAMWALVESFGVA